MREEYEDALKNTGAVLFVIGFTGVCIQKSIALFVIAAIVMVVGITLVATADWIVIQEDNRKQKNKCHRTAKHIDTY